MVGVWSIDRCDSTRIKGRGRVRLEDGRNSRDLSGFNRITKVFIRFEGTGQYMELLKWNALISIS